MWKFKGGVILENKCILNKNDKDGYDETFKNLNIEDTEETAKNIAVKAELLPPDNE